MCTWVSAGRPDPSVIPGKDLHAKLKDSQASVQRPSHCTASTPSPGQSEETGYVPGTRRPGSPPQGPGTPRTSTLASTGKNEPGSSGSYKVLVLQMLSVPGTWLLGPGTSLTQLGQVRGSGSCWSSLLPKVAQPDHPHPRLGWERAVSCPLADFAS